MDENIRTKVEEYGNTHTLEETQERFPFYPVKGILEQAQAKQDEQAQTEEKTATAANIITLKMYGENGKALFSYDGFDRDGNRIQCQGEIASREQAAKIARRTAERCNQFQAHLVFEHGRPVVGNGEIVNFSDTVEKIGDFCLSAEALQMVERELRAARYQSEWGGMTRSWNGS